MALHLAALPLAGAALALGTAPPADRAPASVHAAHRPAPRCAPGAGNCRQAAGRIIFLESRDADGDGDLHLVLAGGRVTGPGLSVIDVERDLRPRRDPALGDWAAAAGPVYTGSYGQRQIQAERLVLDRR